MTIPRRSAEARDFFGILRVLKSVVPHPTGFVCLLTLNSGDFPPQPLGRRKSFFVVRVNFVGKKKGRKLTKTLYYQKLLNLSRAIKNGKPDMRRVPVLSDYLVKLVILASRAI